MSALWLSRRVATGVSALALASGLLATFVIASRPWGCSATSGSGVVTCDWATSRQVALAFFVVAVAVSFIAWKGWGLLLAGIAFPLLALSLVSVLGAFSLSPAALWLSCAFWLLAQGRRGLLIACALASLVLLPLAVLGIARLMALYAAPI
jgi:hypothetical protein